MTYMGGCDVGYNASGVSGSGGGGIGGSGGGNDKGSAAVGCLVIVVLGILFFLALFDFDFDKVKSVLIECWPEIKIAGLTIVAFFGVIGIIAWISERNVKSDLKRIKEKIKDIKPTIEYKRKQKKHKQEYKNSRFLEDVALKNHQGCYDSYPGTGYGCHLKRLVRHIPDYDVTKDEKEQMREQLQKCDLERLALRKPEKAAEYIIKKVCGKFNTTKDCGQCPKCQAKLTEIFKQICDQRSSR